jgi:ACT domain-containing protein
MITITEFKEVVNELPKHNFNIKKACKSLNKDSHAFYLMVEYVTDYRIIFKEAKKEYLQNLIKEIDGLKKTHTMKEACKKVGVSMSNYYVNKRLLENT